MYAVTGLQEAKAYCRQDPTHSSKYHLFILLYVFMDQLMYHPVQNHIIIPEWIAAINMRKEMRTFVPNLLWSVIGETCTDDTFEALAKASNLSMKWHSLTIWAYCLITKQYKKCQQLVEAGYRHTGVDSKAA